MVLISWISSFWISSFWSSFFWISSFGFHLLLLYIVISLYRYFNININICEIRVHREYHFFYSYMFIHSDSAKKLWILFGWIGGYWRCRWCRPLDMSMDNSSTNMGTIFTILHFYFLGGFWGLTHWRTTLLTYFFTAISIWRMYILRTTYNRWYQHNKKLAVTRITPDNTSINIWLHWTPIDINDHPNANKVGHQVYCDQSLLLTLVSPAYISLEEYLRFYYSTSILPQQL